LKATAAGKHCARWRTVRERRGFISGRKHLGGKKNSADVNVRADYWTRKML